MQNNIHVMSSTCIEK